MEGEPMSAPLIVAVSLLVLFSVGAGCFMWGFTVGVDHGPAIKIPPATTLPPITTDPAWNPVIPTTPGP